jgi:exodeoxyribonuclease VII large subunit
MRTHDNDLFAAPRPRREEVRPLTVSEITALIKEDLENAFADVYVVGELSRITRASSGHVYVTLKDEGAVLQAVAWRGVAQGLRFRLEEGLQVVVRGSVDVYAPRGSYQLIVAWMEPRGLGALQLAFRQMQEKLQKEGLFADEHKVPLPAYPLRIALVTSPTGAAVRDMINVIGRRWPLARLYVYPCRVQGEGAAAEIAAGITRLNETRLDLDLLIVGRGGGSMEDLWAFNEEVLARAVFASRIPVVSAVGHEIDFTICDFVADVRAATPTEAGELVVPDRAEVAASLALYRRRLGLALGRVVARARQGLDALAARYAFRRPQTALLERAQRLDDLLERTKTLLAHRLGLLGEALAGSGRRLEALSPLKVLGRGYSLTFGPDGRILRSVEGLAPGDSILSRLHGGEIESEVAATRAITPANVEEVAGEE